MKGTLHWLLPLAWVATPVTACHASPFEGQERTELLDLPVPRSEADVLVFDQMAKKALDGQVINSDQRFLPSKLPATFTARFSDGGFCTATLVGPRVILTAAHCVDLKKRDGNGAWKTVIGGIRLDGEAAIRPFKTCEMAPAYTASKPKLTPKPRNAHDYALCELASTVPLKAETLDLKQTPLTDINLLIAGYGCSEEDLSEGRIPLKPTAGLILRAGMNRVRAEQVEGWITVIGTVGSSAAILCPGDSGGSAYAGVASLDGGAYAKGWRVVAINSAVGPSATQRRIVAGGAQARKGLEYVSYFAPLAVPSFEMFVASFMRPNDAARGICGINRSAPISQCRP